MPLQAVSASAKVLNGDPDDLNGGACARMEGPPRSNKALTPAKAGAGWTRKGDDERNVSAARYPYVQVFDDLMEFQRHTQHLLILVPPSRELHAVRTYSLGFS